MPGLGKATSSRWVGWGTHQALAPEDFVRRKDMWQQGRVGCKGTRDRSGNSNYGVLEKTI